MKKKKEAIVIFNYFNYREYLEAVYSYYKETVSGFSHRSFSQDAGISSPNYLFRVLKGERNLTLNYLPNFTKALKLTREEKQYFEVLIQFNNEKKSGVKEELLRKLLTLRYSKGEYKLKDKKLLFFSKWYYPLLRELVTMFDFKDDYNLISRTCIPRISASQVRNGIKYLIKNDYIKLTTEGTYERVNTVVSTGAEVNSTILRKYHKETIKQCVDMLEETKPKDRDISSLTMSVSRDTYNKIKEEIQSFRKRLLTLAAEDDNDELVCFTGFQLVQKSKPLPDTHKERK